jgi:hypothetical protein
MYFIKHLTGCADGYFNVILLPLGRAGLVRFSFVLHVFNGTQASPLRCEVPLMESNHADPPAGGETIYA